MTSHHLFSSASKAFGRAAVVARATIRGLALPALVAVLAVAALAAPVFAGAAPAAGGTVVKWGSNTFGELGNGAQALQLTPVQAVVITGVMNVAVAPFHTVAVRSDGAVWAWGSNNYGQLGNGTDTARYTPGPVPGLTNITAVASGAYFSLALKSDGTVWAWGNNSYGQLGDGTTTGHNTPRQVPGLGDVIAIAAGSNHSLAVKSDGTVWAWGLNSNGQLGDGSLTNRLAPVPVSLVENVQAVAAGSGHSLALRQDGAVWAWGMNNRGQVGDGTTVRRTTPVPVSGLTGVSSLAAGSSHSLAVKTDGKLLAWGGNWNGQLGDGTWTTRKLPVEVFTNVVSVAGGSAHSLAARGDGTVWTWGYNEYGQLGIASTSDRNTPTQIDGMSGALRVAGMQFGSAIVRADGSVWCFGTDIAGQCGTGSCEGVNPFAFAVGSDPLVTAISAGDNHTLALSDGKIYAWGDNYSGQLGDGTTYNQSTPKEVPGFNGGVAIAAGSLHSMALKGDGSVWTWGYNLDGQLGDNTYDNRYYPSPVPGLSGVTAIAAGDYHSLALSGGQVWAWGDGFYGELGDGATDGRPSPGPVPGLTNVAAVAAGNDHCMALTADGKVWTWGGNDAGQIGDGSTTDRLTPYLVPGVTGITAIAAGASFSLALKSDGTVLAWGGNGWGALGLPSYTNYLTPQAVPGLTGVTAIAARASLHSLALKSDGTVWAAGYNALGQLGNGSAVVRDNTFRQVLGSVGVTKISASGWSSMALTSATLTTPPTITQHPHDVTIPAGATATLTVSAAGSEPLGYAWFGGLLGDEMDFIDWAPNAPYLILPEIPASGRVFARVYNFLGFADSDVATLTVTGGAAPSVTAPPASTTVLPGESVLLAVVAEGTAPLSYQWYTGPSGDTSAPIAGAVSPALVTPPLATTTAFWVRVSNVYGAADSPAAVITVQSCIAPSIVAQPLGSVVPAGQRATLTAQVRGTAPLDFQWFELTPGGTNPVAGATQAWYTTPPLTASATYRLQVHNGCGDLDTATATVTVLSCTPPVITTPPQGTTVNIGATVSLGVSATGTAPLSFQWYDGETGNTANPVPGATTSLLTVGPLNQTRSLWVRVTNACGQADSPAAVVTVEECYPPVFTSQPADTTVLAWQTATLTAAVSGNAPFYYQWYEGPSGDVTLPVSGAIAPVFVTPPLDRTRSFWVRVTNPCGLSESRTVTVTVSTCSPPVIRRQPKGRTVRPGGVVTLSVKAEGQAPFSYQWYQGPRGETGTPVGSNEPSFTTPPVTSTTSWWVRVSNACGSVGSEAAEVRVNGAAPVINSQPQPVTVQAGERATLGVAWEGGAKAGCQWYLGESGDSSNPIAGATSPEYTTPTLNANGSYWVEVGGTAESETVEVGVQGEAAYRLYAAHLATDANWWSRLTLANPGSSATEVVIEAFNGAGVPVYAKGAPRRTLLPGEALSLDAAELVENGSDYWLRLTSQKKVAGVIEFGMRGNATTEVILPLLDTGCLGMVYPYVVSGIGNWYTGLTLLNTTPVSVQVLLSAYREDGTPLGALGPLLIPARGKYVRLVSGLFPAGSGIDPSQIRFLKVEVPTQGGVDENAGPLLGFELFGIFSAQGGLSGLPGFVLPAEALTERSSSTLHLGEVPPDDQWYTGVTFSNLGTAPVTAKADLLDGAGSLLASADLSVGPQSQMTREVWSLFGGTPFPSAARVRVVSPTPLLGFEINAARNGLESLDFDGLLGMGGGCTKQCFPLVRCTGAWTTVLRLTDLSGSTNAYTLKAYDASGAEVGTSAGTVAANAQSVADPAVLFPSVAASVAWVRLESAGPLLAGATLENAATHQIGKYVGIPVP